MGISTSVPLPSVPSLPAIGGGATQNPAKPFLDLMSNAFQARARSQGELDSLTTDFENFLTAEANDRFSRSLGTSSFDSQMAALSSAQDINDPAMQLALHHSIFEHSGGVTDFNALDAGTLVTKFNAIQRANRDSGLIDDAEALALSKKYETMVREFLTKPVEGLRDENNAAFTANKPNGRVDPSSGEVEQELLVITYATLPTFLAKDKRIRDAVVRASTPNGLAHLATSRLLKDKIYYDPEKNYLGGADEARMAKAVQEAIREEVMGLVSKGLTDPKDIKNALQTLATYYKGQMDRAMESARVGDRLRQQAADLGLSVDNPFSKWMEGVNPGSSVLGNLSPEDQVHLKLQAISDAFPIIKSLGGLFKPSATASTEDQELDRKAYTAQIGQTIAPASEFADEVLRAAQSDPTMFNDQGRIDFNRLSDQVRAASQASTSLSALSQRSPRLSEALRKQVPNMPLSEVGQIASSLSSTAIESGTAAALVDSTNFGLLSGVQNSADLFSRAVHANDLLQKLGLSPNQLDNSNPEALRGSLNKMVERAETFQAFRISQGGITLPRTKEQAEKGLPPEELNFLSLKRAVTAAQNGLGKEAFSRLTDAAQAQFSLTLLQKNPTSFDTGEKVRDEFQGWLQSSDDSAAAARAMSGLEQLPAYTRLLGISLKTAPPVEGSDITKSVTLETGGGIEGLPGSDQETRRQTEKQAFDVKTRQAAADNQVRREAFSELLPSLARAISPLPPSAVREFSVLLEDRMGKENSPVAQMVSEWISLNQDALAVIDATEQDLEVVSRLRDSTDDSFTVPRGDLDIQVQRGSDGSISLFPIAPNGDFISSAVESFADVDSFERSIVDPRFRDNPTRSSKISPLTAVINGVKARTPERGRIFVDSSRMAVLDKVQRRLSRLERGAQEEQAAAEERGEVTPVRITPEVRAALGDVEKFQREIAQADPSVQGIRDRRLKELAGEVSEARQQLAQGEGSIDRLRLLLKEVDALSNVSRLTPREKRLRKLQSELPEIAEQVQETVRKALERGEGSGSLIKFDLDISPEFRPRLAGLISSADVLERELPQLSPSPRVSPRTTQISFELGAAEQLRQELAAAEELIRSEIPSAGRFFGGIKRPTRGAQTQEVEEL